MSIHRRLARLERALPGAQPDELTREEERILLYELVQGVLRLGRYPDLEDDFAAYVERTAAEIRKKAASRPPERHINYIEEIWMISGRSLPFVPPVLGSDYDDWFLPGLTERRLAVRRRPSVIVLIGDTTASPWGKTKLLAEDGESEGR